MSTLRQSLDDLAAPETAPRLRVVVCGEVRSGKSTLINALLRGPYLPDNIGQTRRPLVSARYRAQAGSQIHAIDGGVQSLDGVSPHDALRGAARIELFTDTPHLADYELVEVPMTTAEEISAGDREVLASADVLIWVTIASQAWRLTEKTILTQLADVLPDHRVLVVSRADKLRGNSDRSKLMQRVRRETAGLFGECLFLDGAGAMIAASGESEDDWQRTGAPVILRHLQGLLDDAPGVWLEDEDVPAAENLVTLEGYRRSRDATSGAAPQPSPAPLPPLEQAFAEVPQAPAAVPAMDTPPAPEATAAPDVSSHEAGTEDPASDASDPGIAAPAPVASDESADAAPDIAGDLTTSAQPDSGAEPAPVAQSAKDDSDPNATSVEPTAAESVATEPVATAKAASAPCANDLSALAARLDPISDRTPKGTIVGLMALDHDGPGQPIRGDFERAHEISDILRDMLVRTLDIYASHGFEGDDAALSLTAGRMRLNCEVLPGRISLYTCADAQKMSPGIAQNVMNQMRAAAVAQA